MGGACPAGESEGADWLKGVGHRGRVALEFGGRWGFISGAMGKQPEGCSAGQWLRGLVGSQGIKSVASECPPPPRPRRAGSLLLALSQPPQTVPWAREVGDGPGSRLNIGHPKRPSANPWNL